MSCFLQPQNQTKVNINFSLPAGAVAQRVDAERRKAGRKSETRTRSPPGSLAGPGTEAPRCPHSRSCSSVTGSSVGGPQAAATPPHPACPGASCLARVLQPPSRQSSEHRRSGSLASGAGGRLRPGLLLSFGALVCFLMSCNRANFSPCAW